MGPGLHEYRKTYGKNYCLGQLIFWHNQAYAEPDTNLIRASRGCLSLPEIGSFYVKYQKPSPERVYGPRTVKSMLSRMVSFILFLSWISIFLLFIYISGPVISEQFMRLCNGSKWVEIKMVNFWDFK